MSLSTPLLPFTTPYLFYLCGNIQPVLRQAQPESVVQRIRYDGGDLTALSRPFALTGTHMVFVTAGMGGGTGSDFRPLQFFEVPSRRFPPARADVSL
jgi:hypothetical protein